MRNLLAIALALFPAVSAAGDTDPTAQTAPPPAEAAADCAEPTARRVQVHYESIRDLSADFEQTARNAVLGSGPGAEPATTRGRVVFAKPGRMRWEYREPEPSLVVSDGHTLWTYDPGLGEAQRLEGAESLVSGAAIQFLLGEGDLLESFRVSALDCGARPVRLLLEPREPASYERLTLDVSPDGGVRVSEVSDLFGNVTRVAFSNVRTNTTPDPATFRFEPPQGVQVIEVPAAP